MNQKDSSKKISGPERLGIRKNRHYTQISAYVIFTALIIYALIRILDHLPTFISGIGFFFHSLWVILKPLFAGFVIAYLLYRPVEYFRRHLEQTKLFSGKPKRARPLAVAITYLIVIGALVLILSIMIAAASHEIKMLSISDITAFAEGVADSFRSLYSNLKSFLAQLDISSESVDNFMQQITDWLGSAAANAGNSITDFLSNLSSFFVGFFFAIILSIYFLLDAPGLMRYWDHVLRAVCAKKGYDYTHMVLNDINTVFSGYIRGQLMDACFMFVAVSVALSLVGVRFSVLIGLLTGIGNLIPYIGPIFAYGGTALSCLLTQDWQKLIIGLIVVLVIQTIDGNVIGPKLVSHSIHVHPMLVIIALIIGNAVGGLLGMLVSVPTAALIKLWFDRLINYLEKRRERKLRAESDPGKEPPAADR